MAVQDNDTGLAVLDRAPTERRWRPWVVAVVGTMLLVCALPTYLTATPRQCASCHEMEPYYESWQSSSHRAAAPNCLYCHVEPGVFNLIVYEIAFYGEIVAHFTGGEVFTDDISGASAGSCQRDACHSLNREASYSGDIKLNHREHVLNEGVECAQCHPGAVHEGVGGREVLPPVSMCRECHEDEMDDCQYCHDDEVVSSAPSPH